MSLYFRRDLINRIGFYDLNFKLSADFDYAKRLEAASLTKVDTNIIIGTFYTGGRSGGIQTFTENFLINLKHKRSLLVSVLVYSLCLINYFIKKIYLNFKK